MVNTTAMILITVFLLVLILITGFLAFYFIRKSKKRIDAYSKTNLPAPNDGKTKEEIDNILISAENSLSTGNKEKARADYMKIRSLYSKLVVNDEELYKKIMGFYSKIS